MSGLSVMESEYANIMEQWYFSSKTARNVRGHKIPNSNSGNKCRQLTCFTLEYQK